MARKKARKESPAMRYLFYFAALFFTVATIATLYLYAVGIVSINDANTYTSITVSMMFSTVVIAYLYLRGNSSKDIIKMFGLSRDKLKISAITLGLTLFFAILILEVLTGVLSAATGIPLPTNVDQVLGSEPFYFLMFAVFIAPINEEIFFRAFLVPRIGIIISAIIFAVLHAGYASVSEFAAALIFGLLAGYVFKRYKSLYATIIAHMLVNLLAVVAFLLVVSII